MEKITFMPDGESEIEFYVLEQTTIGGVNYILVTDAEEDDEDGEAYIMKAVAGNDDEQVYDMVDDDNELAAVAEVFESMIEDIDLI